MLFRAAVCHLLEFESTSLLQFRIREILVTPSPVFALVVGDMLHRNKEFEYTAGKLDRNKRSWREREAVALISHGSHNCMAQSGRKYDFFTSRSLSAHIS